MKAALKALVLDFGGVITRTMFETHPESEKALGLAPGALDWRGPFAPDGDPLWRSMQAGEISERDYWRTRARQTGRMIGREWTEMVDLVRACRGSDPSAIIRPEALRAIEKVKRHGVKLAILSNELDLFYGADIRGRLPFLASFDAIIDATYTNILKPDPAAYEEVARQLSLPLTACLFMDDQARNIAGAGAVGMTCVHFDVLNPGSGFSRALAHFGLE